MYADTIIQDRWLHNYRFVLLLLSAVTALTYYLDPMGLSLMEAFGIAEEDGGPSAPARLLASVLISAILVGVAVITSLFNKKTQVLISWAIMTLVLGGFFYMFDLSIEFIRSKLWFLVSQGLWTTLYISAISIGLACVIALIAALAKLSDNGMANGIANFYTSLFRGLPLLMQVYLIYIGLPQLGYVVEAIPAGIAALALCYGAYMTEIFRAGIEAIPKGQWEAGRAIGFTPGVMMRRIILPQAIPLVIPAIGNQFIAMLKDSSLISVIGVWELMYLARSLGNQTFQHMEMLITVSMIYWLLTIILEMIQSKIEKAFKHAGR
ncbi:amino acid ABC transporter permease [Candidatus Halocynthiibacter alkanivorans]|uniref:amino acid ABC transporter permease n=1 Tax=Candidatus Halocynthiibacter alkanivorans TaxID=2267619 RepID=UPI000DF25165|nr:amino acid ABC transporter permease [Candidatus Halocynthiibacter alkanivorans]